MPHTSSISECIATAMHSSTGYTKDVNDAAFVLCLDPPFNDEKMPAVAIQRTGTE
jgi:hypothetical protein